MSLNIPCERKLFESLKIKIVVKAGLFTKLLLDNTNISLGNIENLIKKVESFHNFNKTITIYTEVFKYWKSRSSIEILINDSFCCMDNFSDTAQILKIFGVYFFKVIDVIFL